MYHFISYTLFHVLNTQFCWKQKWIIHFTIVAKEGLFWLVTSSHLICDVTQTWCDVIFVYCSCTRKLVQGRSWLVNNNCEYRFLTIRYSRLSVQEFAIIRRGSSHLHVFASWDGAFIFDRGFKEGMYTNRLVCKVYCINFRPIPHYFDLVGTNFYPYF